MADITSINDQEKLSDVIKELKESIQANSASSKAGDALSKGVDNVKDALNPKNLLDLAVGMNPIFGMLSNGIGSIINGAKETAGMNKDLKAAEARLSEIQALSIDQLDVDNEIAVSLRDKEVSLDDKSLTPLVQSVSAIEGVANAIARDLDIQVEAVKLAEDSNKMQEEQVSYAEEAKLDADRAEQARLSALTGEDELSLSGPAIDEDSIWKTFGVDALAETVGSIGGSLLGGIGPALAAMFGPKAILKLLVRVIPIGAILLSLGSGVMNAFKSWMNGGSITTIFAELLEGLTFGLVDGETFKKIGDGVLFVALDTWERIKQAFVDVFNFLGQGVMGIVDSIKESGIFGPLKLMFDPLVNLFDWISDTLGSILTGVKDSIMDTVKDIPLIGGLFDDEEDNKIEELKKDKFFDTANPDFINALAPEPIAVVPDSESNLARLQNNVTERNEVGKIQEQERTNQQMINSTTSISRNTQVNNNTQLNLKPRAESPDMFMQMLLKPDMAY